MTEMIEISKIRTNGGTQSRATMDNETISEYIEVWKSEGGTFPDVTLYYDGSDYWLADGFHRVESAKLAGHTSINAEILQGTLRDAVLHSAGANARHGLKRTNADKRRAALVLLNDEEWSKWSDRAIADKVGVSNRFVSTLRNELSVQRSQMGLPDQTRLVTRGDSTYEMKVTAKQDKELIRNNPVPSNEAIDTELLMSLYKWNDAIGPALPAHLASKARTAVQIAEDLTALIKAGYASTVQSISEDGNGVKSAIVVTLSGCELLKKPFPAKIEQTKEQPTMEVFKAGDKVLILSGFGENKEARIKAVDYSVDPVQFRVQILTSTGEESAAQVAHVGTNLKLIQRAGAAEQPAPTSKYQVGDVVEFYIGYSAQLGQILAINPDGKLFVEHVAMARGKDDQFQRSTIEKASLTKDTTYAHWFDLHSRGTDNDTLVVFAWKDHYITFNSGYKLGYNYAGFNWHPKETWDSGIAYRLSQSFVQKLRKDGVNVVIFPDITALPERMRAIVEKVGRSRGGEVAEPPQETPVFRVGDYVVTLIGERVQIIGINGRIINVKGRNGERNVLVENLKPAPQEQPAAEAEPVEPANQAGDTCPDCGGDLWASNASTMLDGISYCVDCGMKRLPAPKTQPLYPYTDEPLEERTNGKKVTAELGNTDGLVIDMTLGWLMGFDISGQIAPNMEQLFEHARRWIDQLEERYVNEVEPVEA